MVAAKQDGRKRVKRRGSIASKGHKGSRFLGSEDRLQVYVKRTMELKRLGHPYYEIAEMIAEEYQLEKVPHIATVAGWRSKGMDAVNEDIKTLQTLTRLDQFNELERLKAKWLPIATAQELEVKRWVRVEGELQPELDERAVEEQIKATQEVVKIMARQAKLMGLDLEKTLTKDNGEGMSGQELQIWLINAVNNQAADSAKPVEGQVIDVPGEVLELTSGIPGVEEAV